MEDKTLCRICFDIGHFSLTGYEINIQGQNISIEDMIKRFSDLEFTGENIPSSICENCTHDLVQCFLFAQKVTESDAKIMDLVQLKENEKMLVYEEDFEPNTYSKKNVEVAQSAENIKMESEIFEEQHFDSQNIEESFTQIDESQATENRIVFADDQGDLIEEVADPNEMDEVYSDFNDQHENNVNQEEENEENELCQSLEIDQSENVSCIIAPTSNYDLSEIEEESQQPTSMERRRKYQRRHKTNNEIDKNGSFVITQFASSTSAPGTLLNSNSIDDNEEVAVSDVRIMNYETVEVKAGNIDLIDQNPKSELPIDDSRVYLCQYCPRAFSSSAFLIAHVRKTHGCKFCASVFEKATELYAHIREAHSKFQCVVCSKEFISNSNMRNHLKNVHKVKVPPNVSLISYKKHNNVEVEPEAEELL